MLVRRNLIAKLAVIALGIAACGQASVATVGQPISVGFIGVLSGPLAINGELSSRGAQLAVDEINASGGVHIRTTRHQLSLTLTDDTGKPAAGVVATNKLIEEDHAFAILGPEYSNVVLATVPVTQGHKVIQLYSTNSSLSGVASSPYAFRSRVEDSYLAKAVVDYIMHTAGAANTRVAIGYLQNDYGQSGANLISAGLDRASIPVIAKASHNLGDRDLTPSAVAFVRQRVNVVVTWSGPVESILLLRTMRQLGWSGIFIHGNPDTIYASLGGREVDGVVGPQGWVPTDANAVSRKFVKAYTARYNQTPDNHSAAYYDSVYLLKTALEAVGPDPDKVGRFIASLRGWAGVQGRFHPADLQHGSTLTAVSLVQVDQGALRILQTYP